MSTRLKAAMAILIGLLVISLIYFGVIHPTKYMSKPNPPVSPNSPLKSPMKPTLPNPSIPNRD